MLLTGTNLRLFPPNSHTVVDIKNEGVEILFPHARRNYNYFSTHQYINYKANEVSSEEERKNDSQNQNTCDRTNLTDANIYENLMYVCPCILYETEEIYPLDATIYLLL